MDLLFLKPVPVSNKCRIGRDRDGGYVLYQPALDQCDFLIGYGIGWDISFETDLLNHYRINGRIFDHTMLPQKGLFDKNIIQKNLRNGRIGKTLLYCKTMRKWKRKLNRLQKKGIAFVNEGVAAQKEFLCDTLENHLRAAGYNGNNALLKMDIEGNEYALFKNESFLNQLVHFNQVCMEVHDVKNKLVELKDFIAAITPAFTLIHIHGNNYGEQFTLYKENRAALQFPDILELSFTRTALIRPEDRLPHEINYPQPELDKPCDSAQPDYRLEFQ